MYYRGLIGIVACMSAPLLAADVHPAQGTEDIRAGTEENVDRTNRFSAASADSNFSIKKKKSHKCSWNCCLCLWCCGPSNCLPNVDKQLRDSERSELRDSRTTFAKQAKNAALFGKFVGKEPDAEAMGDFVEAVSAGALKEAALEDHAWINGLEYIKKNKSAEFLLKYMIFDVQYKFGEETVSSNKKYAAKLLNCYQGDNDFLLYHACKRGDLELVNTVISEQSVPADLSIAKCCENLSTFGSTKLGRGNRALFQEVTRLKNEMRTKAPEKK